MTFRPCHCPCPVNVTSLHYITHTLVCPYGLPLCATFFACAFFTNLPISRMIIIDRQIFCARRADLECSRHVTKASNGLLHQVHERIRSIKSNPMSDLTQHIDHRLFFTRQQQRLDQHVHLVRRHAVTHPLPPSSSRQSHIDLMTNRRQSWLLRSRH